MPRIILIVPHRPDRSPSQRYRLEQFLPWFRELGFGTLYLNLLDERDDRVFYSAGHVLGKLRILLTAFLRRWRHVRTIRRDDIVIIHREAFMTRGIWFERAIRRRCRHLVFDFDDAIWRMDVSPGNRRLRWLKDPGKTGRLIAMADRVIAGNDYLASYARQYNQRVEVIPTVVDTHRYRPGPQVAKVPVVVGWTGSHTSLAYLQQALPVLRAVQQRFGDAVRFRVVSDTPLEAAGLDVDHVTWDPATEVEDLLPIDIGIMPMPENDWSRGKCGFKGLQYMALGKAVVLQDIGVNSVIVQHGVNGLLASTPAEWEASIGRLLEDADLRRRLGHEARRTVESHWSVKAVEPRYANLLNDLHKDGNNRHRTEEDRSHPRA